MDYISTTHVKITWPPSVKFHFLFFFNLIKETTLQKEEYKQAIEIEDNWAVVYWHYARALYELGEYIPAKEYLVKAKAMNNYLPLINKHFDLFMQDIQESLSEKLNMERNEPWAESPHSLIVPDQIRYSQNSQNSSSNSHHLSPNKDGRKQSSNNPTSDVRYSDSYTTGDIDGGRSGSNSGSEENDTRKKGKKKKKKKKKQREEKLDLQNDSSMKTTTTWHTLSDSDDSPTERIRNGKHNINHNLGSSAFHHPLPEDREENIGYSDDDERKYDGIGGVASSGNSGSDNDFVGVEGGAYGAEYTDEIENIPSVPSKKSKKRVVKSSRPSRKKLTKKKKAPTKPLPAGKAGRGRSRMYHDNSGQSSMIPLIHPKKQKPLSKSQSTESVKRRNKKKQLSSAPFGDDLENKRRSSKKLYDEKKQKPALRAQGSRGKKKKIQGPIKKKGSKSVALQDTRKSEDMASQPWRKNKRKPPPTSHVPLQKGSPVKRPSRGPPKGLHASSDSLASVKSKNSTGSRGSKKRRAFKTMSSRKRVRQKNGKKKS